VTVGGHGVLNSGGDDFILFAAIVRVQPISLG